MAGPVTAVYSTEQMLSSAVPGFPLTPVSTLLAEPDAYAAAAGLPDLAAELTAGMVLAQTEAELRKAQVGDTITLTNGHTFPVTAVVPDQVIGGYEMATSDQLISVPAKQPAAYLLVGGMPSVTALAAGDEGSAAHQDGTGAGHHDERVLQLVRHGAHPAGDQAAVR